MSDSSLLGYAQRELNYHARKEIAKGIREHCPDGDPMTTNMTVMLGSILAMAVFSAMVYGKGKGRGR